jgi:aldose sugar dehydrogenase
MFDLRRTLVGVAVAAACGTAHAQKLPFAVTELADFEVPWALEFVPDGRLLVTEQKGAIKLYTPGSGTIATIEGALPAVAYGGQGGLSDIVLHPRFAQNGFVYLSYAEPGAGDTRGAAVARGKLTLTPTGGSIAGIEVIWRQSPKVDGGGHFSHRIAFAPDGKLFISSGDRQKFDPAQDMQANLGKVIRLNDDGSVPSDNPFSGAGVTPQIWTLGHRNPLGLAFDAQGKLWELEMGPQGGDELNLVVRGENYGYPIVSNGDHYDGKVIPDHPTRPEFKAPAAFWNPVISPSSLMIYSGSEFPEWRGNAFIGGLSSQSIVRIEFDGEKAREAERFPMGMRIRAVEQGPDGAIWVLEDEREGRGGKGRLYRLTDDES